MLAEKEATVETLQNEKQKMEDKLESERLKYEEKIRDLEKSQYANELLQQETFEKMNQEFGEKMGQNQNEFEAAIKVEKKEREEERQRLAQELKVCLFTNLQLFVYIYTYTATGCSRWIVDILKSYYGIVFCAKHHWWKNVYILIFGL